MTPNFASAPPSNEFGTKNNKLHHLGFVVFCNLANERDGLVQYNFKELLKVILVSVHGVPMVFLRSLGTTTSGLSLKIPVNRNPTPFPL